MPGYRHKVVLCSHLKYLICDCIQLLLFALSDSILKHELSSDNKAVYCLELTKIVSRQGPSAYFCAREQGRDLVLGHQHCAQILAWVLERKWCVHISAQ